MTTSALERAAAGDRRAVGVERAAAAVEDEVVVAAELVDVDDRHAVLRAPCCRASLRAAGACRPRTATPTG